MNASIVSQRRVFAPFGLEGGEDGARGENWWIRRLPADEIVLKDVEEDENGPVEWINLGHNGSTTLKAGDRIRIMTPGGGGWGKSIDK